MKTIEIIYREEVAADSVQAAMRMFKEQLQWMVAENDVSVFQFYDMGSGRQHEIRLKRDPKLTALTDFYGYCRRCSNE